MGLRRSSVFCKEHTQLLEVFPRFCLNHLYPDPEVPTPANTSIHMEGLLLPQDFPSLDN